MTSHSQHIASFWQHSSIQRPLFVKKNGVNTLLIRPPYRIDLDRRFGTCRTIWSDPQERCVPLHESTRSTGSTRPMARGLGLVITISEIGNLLCSSWDMTYILWKQRKFSKQKEKKNSQHNTKLTIILYAYRHSIEVSRSHYSCKKANRDLVSNLSKSLWGKIYYKPHVPKWQI